MNYGLLPGLPCKMMGLFVASSYARPLHRAPGRVVRSPPLDAVVAVSSVALIWHRLRYYVDAKNFGSSAAHVAPRSVGGTPRAASPPDDRAAGDPGRITGADLGIADGPGETDDGGPRRQLGTLKPSPPRAQS